ncbi:MAG: osmoprotectant transport system permease protein, partial [Pseudonocardiales bacterium]|nr:osmoprotectant transport system permease protein [Pseudonocardiales bacterium]
MNYLSYLFDAANWSGSQGIPQRLVEHLGYTALTMIIALAIG